MRMCLHVFHIQFESSVKLVWSPIYSIAGTILLQFESSVKLVWSPIQLYPYVVAT